jgi:4-amino-4-deoxy-L-arabinose transferase-like glycosyltransferase
VGVQIALFVAMGLFVAGRQAFWGSIDEAAHVSYVQIVATEHRLPVLGRDCLDPTLFDLQRGYTGPLARGPDCGRTFDTASYEAFQPPLAYVLYAPIYRLPFGLRAKAYLLRVASLATLLAAFVAMCLFVRREFGAGWAPVLALAGTFFLVPGVLVRGAALSNATLEILVASLFLVQAWRAARTGSAGRLVAAGALLGLALLTKLTLVYLCAIYLVAAVAVLRRSRTRRTLATAVAGAGCAAALVAPWLAFNHHHYGTLTANSQARRMQQKLVNPTHYRFGASDVPARALLTVDLLPEEWEPTRRPTEGDSLPLARPGRFVVPAALLAAAIASLALGLRDRSRRRYAWFLLPAALSLLVMVATLLHSQWDIMLPRYLYPAGPPVAVAVAAAAAGRFPRLAVPLAASVTIALTAVFVVYAHMHYGLG